VTEPVRAAATVVLLRPGLEGPEVFLVRRHQAIAFMGGAYVFPGGRVEESDRDAAWLSVSDGLTGAAARMPDEDVSVALALHVAAARETFEEAGVLLARAADGAFASLMSEDAAEFAKERRAVSTGRRRLIDLLVSHHWRLAVDALAYFAHWVTPPIETRRFDTRFFLAALPAGQEPTHDMGETVDGVWLRPRDAVARCLDRTIALPPPTWTTLRWLEAFSDIEAAVTWARHKLVPRIEPGFIHDNETRIVTLPGDPTLPAVEGFDARETRFLLTEGRWTPIDEQEP
jgi:8-oxo-dGTP pyrophosphatase MutT (NUDIX family)